MAEAAPLARPDIKLAIFGEAPRYFPGEEVATLADVIRLGQVPTQYDVRLNGVSVARTSFSEMPVKTGDLIIAVPQIEGGR